MTSVPPLLRRFSKRTALVVRWLVTALTALQGMVGAGGGAPVQAYVRSRTESGSFVPLYWTDPRKILEVSRPPVQVGISDDQLRAAAQAALSSWSAPAIPCTGISLRLAGNSTDSQLAGQDGRNRIIMRTGAWCRDPVNMEKCHDLDAVAVTSTFSRDRPGRPRDGEIVEADIEINAVGAFQWGIIPDGPVSGRDFANVYDLATVLTHEVGHFLGFGHNCLSGPAAPLEVDDDDNDIPSCSSLPANKQASIEGATMFPFMQPLLVGARTLSTDDSRAACEVYPFWGNPLYEWQGGAGCSHAPVPIAGAPEQLIASAVFMAALAIFSLIARRQRRRAIVRKSAPMPRNRRFFWARGGPAVCGVVFAATPRNDWRTSRGTNGPPMESAVNARTNTTGRR